MTLTTAGRTTIEQDMVTNWEALFRLRATTAITPEARERQTATENRHLRELQRLSLLAARLYAEDEQLVQMLMEVYEGVEMPAETEDRIRNAIIAGSRATEREDASAHGSSH